MEKFADILQGFLGTLGLTATYLWPKAVYYTWVTAWVDLLVWVGFNAFMAGLGRWMRKRAAFRKASGIRDFDEEATSAMNIAAVVIISAAVFGTAIAVTLNLPAILMPEWATVRDLLPK